MKTKLLFVNGHLKIGGVEKALVDLLSSIDYSRYDVDLLLLEGEGDYISLLPPQVHVLHKDTRQLDGPFLSVLLRNLAKLRIGNCLYRIIQSLSKSFGRRYLRLLSCLLPCKKKYDVAIAFRPGHSAEIAAYAIKADKKFIWWHHGVVPDKTYQIHKLGELFRVFDKAVTVSDGCRGMLKDCFHLPDDKLAVIPNIVDDGKLKVMAEGDDPFGDDHRFFALCYRATMTSLLMDSMYDLPNDDSQDKQEKITSTSFFIRLMRCIQVKNPDAAVYVLAELRGFFQDNRIYGNEFLSLAEANEKMLFAEAPGDYYSYQA